MKNITLLAAILAAGHDSGYFDARAAEIYVSKARLIFEAAGDASAGEHIEDWLRRNCPRQPEEAP